MGWQIMPILYIDQQEKQLKETLKYVTAEYDVRDLKYGDYTNDEETFVVERKSWQDYYNSVMDGSLMAQCDKIRQNFKGLAGVIFEGDFWAMVETIKNKGIRHRLVFTRYRVTCNYNMFFQEVYDKYDLVKTVEFLNENGGKINKNATGFEKKYVKTGDRRILPLVEVPSIGKKLAGQIIKRYKTIFNFLWEILQDEKSVIESLDRFGPKTLDNVVKMFLVNGVYGKKVLTKKELKKLQAFHAKKKVRYEKIKERRHGS